MKIIVMCLRGNTDSINQKGTEIFKAIFGLVLWLSPCVSNLVALKCFKANWDINISLVLNYIHYLPNQVIIWIICIAAITLCYDHELWKHKSMKLFCTHKL